MIPKEELPACPVATTVQLIGNKWKLLIMRNLLVRPWRFNELQKSLEGISQKVLTDNLRSMEGPQMLIFCDNANGQNVRPSLGYDKSGARFKAPQLPVL